MSDDLELERMKNITADWNAALKRMGESELKLLNEALDNLLPNLASIPAMPDGSDGAVYHAQLMRSLTALQGYVSDIWFKKATARLGNMIADISKGAGENE